jgi:phage tail-like protein
VLYDWYHKSTVQVDPVTLVITLLDTTMKPVRVWNLINAYPVKWTGGDLSAASTEILTESLEIAHSGIAITAVAA